MKITKKSQFLLGVTFAVTVLLFIGCEGSGSNIPKYKDANAPIEQRVKDLISRMTLEEKILQLNQNYFGYNSNINNVGEEMVNIPAGIGSLIFFGSDPEMRNKVQKRAMEETRLGIPILFGFDVIHGFRTVYPISLAQACSWNPELVTQACAIAAKEAYLTGINWTFSPMIDVSRDPRWGRVSEGYGECPYVNSVFGVATVNGYQGDNLSDKNTIAACLKHYVGYGASEGGRDYVYSDISMQSLWETHLPSFEAGVKAGAATVMSSFNDISGVPASANYYTLTELLKNKWGHEGFVVSDWNSIQQLTAQGVAKDDKEATYKAFMAGIEMNMKDNIYLEHLSDLVAEKKIPVKKIDEAVARILTLKFRLGLFENPYTDITTEEVRYLKKEDVAVAEKLAEESYVLLKNNNSILPLSNNIKRIALVGPIAKDKENLLGSWSHNGKSENVESVYEGLEKEFQKTIVINYAKGCDFDGTDESGYREAVLAAQKSDIIVLCLGELKTWSGENASRASISLPVIQEKLVYELKKTGKPIVLVLSNGRPLELVRIEPLVDAIIEIWQPGIAGGSPLAGIISGRINPSGRLAVTFPRTVGQIPMYYNMRPSARPYDDMGNYQDLDSLPMYSFGHGLSYTNYEYSNLKLSKTAVKRNEKVIAEVTVKNTGKMDGKETVLWYISDPVSSISRPIKELKFFEKKEIKRNEQDVYVFEIDPMRDLSYVDDKGNRILEAGEFFIHVSGQKIKLIIE